MVDAIQHTKINDIVPWQAQYTFPTQALKIHKQTTKFPPKNGSSFGGSGQSKQLRFEFPSDAYLNPLNTTLLMDFEIKTAKPAIDGVTMTVKTDAAHASTNGTVTIEFTATNASALLTSSITANAYRGGFVEIKSGPLAVGRVFQIVSHGARTTDNTTDTVGSVVLQGDGATELLAKVEDAYNETYTVRIHSGTRLQSAGIHEVVKSIRVLYGGLVLEEIREYNQLARILLNGAPPAYRQSSGRILDGICGTNFMASTIHGKLASGTVYMEGENSALRAELDLAATKKRFALKLFSGILMAKKLIPLKWMAAQFVLEINLADSAECLIGTECEGTTAPYYEITNANILAELLEFDSTFDSGFFVGLRETGVPIKFSSWHQHSFNITGSRLTAQIHERARSVKSAMAIVKDSGKRFQQDTLRGFFDINQVFTNAGTGELNGNWARSGSTACPVLNYQFRVGGKYFPAQPVDCQYGAVEAYVEYLKMMDGLGDYTYAPMIDGQSWAGTNSYRGGDKFIMAAEFEHVDVFPDTISGINAEEQSDMAMIVQWDGDGTVSTKNLDVFVAYDALLVIRDGNVVNLVL